MAEPEGWLRCLECGHWFADEKALVRDFYVGLFRDGQNVFDFPEDMGAEQILSCPHCSHDF